ncbi:MAG: hypothetical protein PVH19_07560 [Planctomycetia bacterium]|jgi:hypothetical protein
MAAKKPTKRPSLIPVPTFLTGPIGWVFTAKPGRSFLMGILLVVGFGLTIYFCWCQVSGEVLASSEYQVDLEEVIISMPPPWVHADLRKDVFQDLSVEGPISIMDENVLKRFQDAFALHPWVEKVVRVSRGAGEIHIELKYRQPACIVAASGRWFPVDRKGYVLPCDDFSPSDLQELPKVVGIDTLPVISDGAYWNDKRVDAAAQIGEVLRPSWRSLKLDKIQPAQLPYRSTQKEVRDFELVTRGGTVFIWGKSQSEKSSTAKTMLSNQEKASKLKHYFEQHGTLDVPGNRVLDLRGATNKVAKAK